MRCIMNFNSEQRYFNHFRNNLSDDAKAEYELGIKNLLERYNTTIYENRFIVGGVVEVFTLALLRSTGIAVFDYGSETAAGDLILPEGRMFSVKSSFTKTGDIRLVNTMGESDTVWKTATLFVLSNVGIVYGDPSMVVEGDLKRVKDALTIKRAAVNRFAEDVSNLVAMDIPLKPPKEATGKSHKASTAVARQLMDELKMVNLMHQINRNRD